MKKIFSILLSVSVVSTTAQAELSKETILKVARSIDKTIDSENAKKDIKPNSITDDSTFVRRAHLNIIGRIPTYQEAKKFLDNKDSNKRQNLIDSLLDSKGYESHMFNFYANLLRLKTNQEQFGIGWNVWLKKQVSNNTPYDQVVYQMLTASGHASQNPAVGYYLRDRGMLLDNISNTSKVFLGTEIGCAQCHDHPFDDMTQKEYYQLAAFGAGIRYTSKKKNEKQKANEYRREARTFENIFRNFRRNAISIDNYKNLKLPDDYQYNDGKPGDPVTAAVLFGEKPDLPSSANRLEHMASWVTDKSNPMFSKVIANRLWKHALGYGLVEPDDAWTERTNISHPAVLDLLVKTLHNTNYDIKQTLRVICHTSIFQREACLNDIKLGGTHDFRGPLLRRMSAEEIHDSLLTLKLGNIDEDTSSTLSKKWSEYQAGSKNLQALEAPELIELANFSNKAEEEFKKARIELNILKAKVTKHRNNGEIEKADKLQKEIKNSQLALKGTRANLKNNDNPQMASMINMNYIRVNTEKTLRASERPSPAASGTLLRNFGSSDRETSNAQHTKASIPQALAMLNGNEIQKITDKQGALIKLISGISKDDEKLETLFISIYSRPPSRKEKSDYLHMMKKLVDMRSLTKAMLASKRFLFVQ